MSILLITLDSEELKKLSEGQTVKFEVDPNHDYRGLR